MEQLKVLLDTIKNNTEFIESSFNIKTQCSAVYSDECFHIVFCLIRESKKRKEVPGYVTDM